MVKTSDEYGICPLMGVGGHQCTLDCEWYIENDGCAMAVIARNTLSMRR